jgi:hypothetical protein
VVLELLALGRRRAEERALGEEQVGAPLVVFRVDQEVLLLGAERRDDLRRVALEVLEDAEGGLVQGLDGA